MAITNKEKTCPRTKAKSVKREKAIKFKLAALNKISRLIKVFKILLLLKTPYKPMQNKAAPKVKYLVSEETCIKIHIQKDKTTNPIDKNFIIKFRFFINTQQVISV